MSYDAGKYDVAVIGAGHAGIEAALASARLGCRTVIFTINMDAVGNCPCNPSIGGTAKGHLVREVDALGGEMGKTADECTLQSRMLNLGKGPAVHSLRAQIDRNKYARVMKHKLEQCENLVMRQAEVIDIKRDGENWLLTTRLGAVYTCRAVVLATGTFLGGRIFVGEVSYAGGPDGMFPATELAGSLKELGISLRRFKTGTPARVLRSSIDFTDLEVQKGDEPVTPFSFDAEMPPKNSAVCYVSWTNDRTKQVILDNIHRSPLYAGMIEGVGPRYCPSIEDKIMRFSEKPRHQLFIEPYLFSGIGNNGFIKYRFGSIFSAAHGDNFSFSVAYNGYIDDSSRFSAHKVYRVFVSYGFYGNTVYFNNAVIVFKTRVISGRIFHNMSNKNSLAPLGNVNADSVGNALVGIVHRYPFFRRVITEIFIL